jgi:hypothetical protein
MTKSIRKMIVLCLWVVVVVLLAAPIQGQEIKPDKVKLTGEELPVLKPGDFSFGINSQGTMVSIVKMLEDGKLSLYWRSLANPLVWGTDIGTGKIVGDQSCLKWTFGPETCSDIYRVGEDKYESWSGGTLALTWYRGQIEFETSKDKIKLTGAELKEGENQYGVSAGVDKKNKTVSIVIDYPDGKRELYWQSFMKPGLSGSWTGTRRVVGDKFCHKLTFNPEMCFDVYQIDEDKSEIWSDEGIQVISYRLK